MDHGQHVQCPHGFCLEHDPEWENIGKVELVPNPVLVGLPAIYIFERHCGKPMLRMKEVQLRRCKKCDRKDLHRRVAGVNVALCGCCGYHYDCYEVEY